jgi:methionyl-tRNA formyltransferase
LSTDIPPLRLAFAGTPDFAVPALDALSRAQPVSAVFTQPDRPAGRGQPLHASPVKRRAAELGLTVHQPPSFKSPEPLAILRSLDLDALIVVAYGLILPPAALAVPRLGCINIHASLLPRWRGAAPIQRALLAGDARTGVTIMRMEAALDTGPMLATRAIDVGDEDNARSLHDRLALLGAGLIVETLAGLAHGSVPETPQPAQGVTYAEKIAKSEALIDWRQDAESLSRLVRAFNPWPVAETRLNGVQLRVWDAQAHGPMRAQGPAPAAPESVLAPGSVLAATPQGIDVACGRGVLRIRRLQLAGRKPLSAHEFIQGHPLDGARFGSA